MTDILHVCTASVQYVDRCIEGVLGVDGRVVADIRFGYCGAVVHGAVEAGVVLHGEFAQKGGEAEV